MMENNNLNLYSIIFMFNLKSFRFFFMLCSCTNIVLEWIYDSFVYSRERYKILSCIVILNCINFNFAISPTTHG